VAPFRLGPPPFADRRDAGRQLAQRLADLAGHRDVIILALPRGGVPVGFEVATALGAPMRVLLVRKIGAPGNPELALGAVAADGTTVIDRALAVELGVTDRWIATATEHEQAELRRRAELLAAWQPPADLMQQTVVLVDDGVATGATVEAALRALAAMGTGRVILAVPVGPPDTLARLAALADRVATVITPDTVFGVGAWYADFGQVSDAEVLHLLEACQRALGADAGGA
jgi:putative phosphoribosyl transferase